MIKLLGYISFAVTNPVFLDVLSLRHLRAVG